MYDGFPNQTMYHWYKICKFSFHQLLIFTQFDFFRQIVHFNPLFHQKLWWELAFWHLTIEISLSKICNENLPFDVWQIIFLSSRPVMRIYLLIFDVFSAKASTKTCLQGRHWSWGLRWGQNLPNWQIGKLANGQNRQMLAGASMLNQRPQPSFFGSDIWVKSESNLIYLSAYSRHILFREKSAYLSFIRIERNIHKPCHT